MKKTLSLILALVMSMSLMTACSGGTSASSAAPAASSGAQSVAESSAAASAPAASTPAKKDKMVIAGIYKAGDQQWFIGEGAAAKKKALAMGASDFLFIDAKMNPDTYLQALDNAITQGVSGIIVCVPDQKLSAITVQKCAAANIPVIAADDQLLDDSGKQIAPWVGIDSYNIGQSMGQWTGKYIQDHKISGDDVGLLLLTMDQVSSCVPRTKGQYDTWMKTFPDWPANRVFRADYNGEQDKGYNAAAGIFTGNPKIKKWIIMTPNDEGAAGACRALEAAGLDKDAVVCGMGGYLGKLDFEKKEETCFKATAYIDYNAVGEATAEEMMNFLQKGTKIPEKFATPAKMATRENYKEIMGN